MRRFLETPKILFRSNYLYVPTNPEWNHPKRIRVHYSEIASCHTQLFIQTGKLSAVGFKPRLISWKSMQLTEPSSQAQFLSSESNPLKFWNYWKYIQLWAANKKFSCFMILVLIGWSNARIFPLIHLCT